MSVGIFSRADTPLPERKSGRYRPQFVWWWTTKSKSLLSGGLHFFRLFFAFLARFLVQLRHLLPPTPAWNVQKSRTASSVSFLLLSASAVKFCFWRVIPVWCSAWSSRRVNVLLSLVPSFLLIWFMVFFLITMSFSMCFPVIAIKNSDRSVGS